MYRGLVLSRAYAQIDSPGGQIERSLLSNIDPQKFHYIVYSSDKDGKVIQSPICRVIHDRVWVKYAAALVRSVFPDLTWLPGYEWYAWDKSALKHIRQEVDFSSIDYIHTFSYPCSDHWAGLKLKQETHKPWIAQFYDPWVENPYRRFKTKYFKRKDYAMERMIAENADLIIHNSQAMAKSWHDRYGDAVKDKIVVLPMPISLPESFKKIDLAKRDKKIKDQVIMSHIGSFMSGRSSECFIETVKEMVTETPEYRKRFFIYYVGDVTQKEKDLINSYQLNDVFSLVGRVSENDCLSYYINSDVFLAIDGENMCNLFYPSKILKYFYFGKPILGITTEGSVLECGLQATRNRYYKHGDRQGMKNFLITMINDYPALCDIDTDYWKKYEPHNVAIAFEKVIEIFFKRRND